MSPKVSIIMPVYNAQEFLHQTLDSLLTQTMKDFELIAVDDGSTDDSAAILESYKANDPRIRLIHQTNQTTSAARNNGLPAATGKYIIFLDSDDIFRKTMLEEAYEAAEKYQADVVAFNYFDYDHKTHKAYKTKSIFPSSRLVSQTERAALFDLKPMTWNKLLLRSFVEKEQLRFQVLPKYDDIYFGRMSVYLAKRVYYLKKTFVYYRTNNINSVQGNPNKHFLAFLQTDVAICSELRRRNITDPVIMEHVRKKINLHLRFVLNPHYDINDIRQAFAFLKEHIATDLYGIENNIPKDSYADLVCKSSGLDEYYLRQINLYYVLKSSVAYRTGNILTQSFTAVRNRLSSFRAGRALRL